MALRSFRPREEIDAIIKEVSLLDREPLSEEVLLKAVRYLANWLEVEVAEGRSERGYLQFRSRGSGDIFRVRVDDLHYHCWRQNVMQGDASEWNEKATSELAWKVCNHPYKYLVLTPKVAKQHP